MSDHEEDFDLEEGGDVVGSPVARVLRRSLNMRRGKTETPRLRRSPQGWSERGQALVDRFDELIAIYDRIYPLMARINEDDGDREEALVAQFEALVNGIDTITAAQVDKTAKARDRAKDLVVIHISSAVQLEKDLQDYDADGNASGVPADVQALLTSGSPTAQRLVQAAQKGRLEALIDSLPDTQATITALEQTEDLLLTPPGIVSKEAHEVFFRKKTDAFETVVGDKVADSENPKLAGLQGVPPDQYWKMLMDGRNQGDDNKHFYDRSFGYMASMMKGLDTIVTKIDEPMSIDFIEEMHQCATYQVTTETRADVITNTVFQEQGLKKAPNGWGCCYNFSDEGLEELTEQRVEMNAIVPGYFADDVPDQLTRGGVTKAVPKFKAAEGLRGQSAETIQAAVTELMEHTLRTYQEDLAEAEEDEDEEDAKIGAIIDCCRRLGQIHPFKDANGRLNMFLLLNKMLLENQMSPTILDDQGDMIGKSRAELIVLIRQGQARVDGMKPPPD